MSQPHTVSDLQVLDQDRWQEPPNLRHSREGHGCTQAEIVAMVRQDARLRRVPKTAVWRSVQRLMEEGVIYETAPGVYLRT